MIRGRRPQAYDAYNKRIDTLFIPAESIDFRDQKDLETKTREILEDLETVKAFGNIINRNLSVPKQLGTLIYNGEFQTPVFDIRSSRILISGDTVKKEAGTYTAVATILNGTWDDPNLNAKQPVVWSIIKKRISKPFVVGTYFVDGSLKTVQLCNYNSTYCEVTGRTQASNAGTYEVTVKITDSNVTWDDGTVDSINLSWQIIKVAGGSSCGGSVPVTVITEIQQLQNSIAILQKHVAHNRFDINMLLEGEETRLIYNAVTDSLKRRLEMLELFLNGIENLSIAELIAFITKYISQLEVSTRDLPYEDLTKEVNSIIELIDSTLERATEPTDIETLNKLRVRAQDIFKIKLAEEQLKNFEVTLRHKAWKIKELLLGHADSTAINNAKTILEELKRNFENLLDSIDDNIKQKITASINRIRDKILKLETDIVRKEVRQILNTVEQKLAELRQKIFNGEDVSALISEIRNLLTVAKDKAEPYNLPFEKDRIAILENLVNELQSQYDNISQRISEIRAMLARIRQRIYDEDLDILWAELNAVETIVNSMSTYFRSKDIDDEIAEIKRILNSFGINNTLDNLLNHLKLTAQIVVTTDMFNLDGFTYDSAKDNLIKLEQLAISVSDDDMLSFPGWYSLSNADKSYLFENNLRKLRRNVLTIKDTFSA